MLQVETRPSPPLLTRRGLVRDAAAAVGLGALGACVIGSGRLAGGRRKVVLLPSFASHASGPVAQFVSRPDLRPPAAIVTGASQTPGYLFLGPGAGAAQAGPLMVDSGAET